MIWCRKYVDDMLRKCAGKMHYTDPAIKGMRQKNAGIIHVIRRRMYITAVIAEWNSKPADHTLMLYRCGAHLRAYMHAVW